MENINTSSQSTAISLKSNPYKNLFFLFLCLFLIVSGILVVLLINQKQSEVIENTPTSLPTLSEDQTISAASVVTVTKSEDELVECYQNDQYFVASKFNDNNEFLVKNKTNKKDEIDCSYTKENSDFEITIPAGWYLALQNQFLLIDQGTGPSGRILIIYDLAKKQEILNTTYDGNQSQIIISDNQVLYWEVSQTEPTSENCPNLDQNKQFGFGSIISNKIKLTLDPFEKTVLTESRCSATQ